MGRTRRDATTKVWHNPDISGRRGGHTAAPRPAPTLEDRRTASAHRAALEALFTPKKDDSAGSASKAVEAATGKAQRIVLAPPPQADPRAADRQKLLGKLLHAEGRPAISKAANELFKHGFTLPAEQDVYLQLLEHTNEERVRDAIAALASILLGELPKRRAVLQSRLRRIEEYAEDRATRDAAAELWRQVTGRGVASSAKGAAPAPAANLPSIESPPSVEEAAAEVAAGSSAGEPATNAAGIEAGAGESESIATDSAGTEALTDEPPSITTDGASAEGEDDGAITAEVA